MRRNETGRERERERERAAKQVSASNASKAAALHFELPPYKLQDERGKWERATKQVSAVQGQQSISASLRTAALQDEAEKGGQPKR